MKHIIYLAFRFFPRGWLHRMAGVFITLIAPFYRGTEYSCNICNHQLRKFIPYGVNPNNKHAHKLCPFCLSLDRHRLIWSYLHEKTDFFTKEAKVLHIAPERCFISRCKRLSNLKYQTADLYSPWADLKFDLQSIPLPDDSYDVIICNHVLEHVYDDKKAMRELHRILKKGGWSILNSGMKYSLEKTIEDLSDLTHTVREERFAQHDHWRLYGMDYADILSNEGFTVKADTYFSSLPLEYKRKHGIEMFDLIYIAAK